MMISLPLKYTHNIIKYCIIINYCIIKYCMCKTKEYGNDVHFSLRPEDVKDRQDVALCWNQGLTWILEQYLCYKLGDYISECKVKKFIFSKICMWWQVFLSLGVCAFKVLQRIIFLFGWLFKALFSMNSLTPAEITMGPAVFQLHGYLWCKRWKVRLPALKQT